jgi:hypothetical protein
MGLPLLDISGITWIAIPGIFNHGDNAMVSLACMDEGGFKFLKEAEVVAFNKGNLAAPATPQSNISDGSVGYFIAQTVSSKTE